MGKQDSQCTYNVILRRVCATIVGVDALWRSWLRHRATSRKVAGPIPDTVIGIFDRHNPYGRTVALGSTQPLRKMSTRNIF
jgi:hypothetical protein